MRQLKLLILDVDGVLTDGTKTYDNGGNCIAKQFCDQDFTAIKRFRDAGVAVCWLTADMFVNEQIAKNRGIDFFYAREPDGSIVKSKFIQQFREQYRVSPREMMYVGDDFYDLEMMKALKGAGGMTACPKDAVYDVQRFVDYVLDEFSGCGVVAELFDDYHRGR